MSGKPFKTHNQMIRTLRDRGLIIADGAKAKRILERENYYCVINGYKDLFLLTSDPQDIYREGTKFEEIFALFCLDREIKQLLLPEIIKFESFAKTMIAYHFHKEFPEKNSYLAFENYSQEASKTKEVLRVISSLSSNLSQKNSSSSIKHYIAEYQHCPLWVLVNFLTFGNISKTFNVFTPKVRINISKDISYHYKKQYNIRNAQISPEMLDECLGAMVVFRNVCAHDERLYNYKVKFKHVALGRLLGYRFQDHRQNRVFEIIVLLKLFLNKSDYKKMIRRYKKIFDSYESKFSTISIEDIKSITGYDTEWIERHC